MADTTVSEGFDGGSVTLRVGDTLTVELRENPTTGFRWAPTTLDASILARIDDDYRSATGAGVGGGGLHVFRLRALRSGTTSVEWRLARSWEADPPRATLRFAVVVT